MGRKKSSRAKSGTWFTRDLLLSPAYVKLSSAGKTILGVFMLKRDMNNNHECVNKHNINVTYKELEALGMSRGSISNGFTDLLAKGFIFVVRQGGAYKEDKTVYGLANDWTLWRVGSKPMRSREKGKRAGYHALKDWRESNSQKSQPQELDPYTPQELNPKECV